MLERRRKQVASASFIRSIFREILDTNKQTKIQIIINENRITSDPICCVFCKIDNKNHFDKVTGFGAKIKSDWLLYFSTRVYIQEKEKKRKNKKEVCCVGSDRQPNGPLRLHLCKIHQQQPQQNKKKNARRNNNKRSPALLILVYLQIYGDNIYLARATIALSAWV